MEFAIVHPDDFTRKTMTRFGDGRAAIICGSILPLVPVAILVIGLQEQDQASTQTHTNTHTILYVQVKSMKQLFASLKTG